MNAQAAEPLAIGWASRDVSTDAPVPIPGQFHIRVSQGVRDPITATALVIENGADALIFVSADFVSIQPHLVNRVRARVAAQMMLAGSAHFFGLDGAA